jgi:hypothetical protein
VYLLGPLHCPRGLLGELLFAGDAVEVGCPLEFRSRVTVAGFVEESAANVVPHVGFFHAGGGELQGFFVQLRGFVPAVLVLKGLCEYQQQFRSVRGTIQEVEAFLQAWFSRLSSVKNRTRSIGGQPLARAFSSALRSRTTSRSVAGSVCHKTEASFINSCLP